MIKIDRDEVKQHLHKYFTSLFELPEIKAFKIRNIMIENNAEMDEQIDKALDAGYHDCYSDTDLALVIGLKTGSAVTGRDYMEHPERYGIFRDDYLGFKKCYDSGICRVIFKNGIRCDIGFFIEHDDSYEDIDLTGDVQVYPDDNKDWPIGRIDDFWFEMIQALAKLYRGDYLISSHLANVCINDTLVQQMVLRDIEHGTNHHRYGYKEKPEYLDHVDACPFISEDPIFNLTAGRLYAAALAYDELTKRFYPEHTGRSSIFFDIWSYYDDQSKKQGR